MVLDYKVDGARLTVMSRFQSGFWVKIKCFQACVVRVTDYNSSLVGPHSRRCGHLAHTKQYPSIAPLVILAL